MSPRPAADFASETTDLRFPTSSIADRPSANENATIMTPDPVSELPYEPRTVIPTPSPYRSRRASDNTPESINPFSTSDSSASVE